MQVKETRLNPSLLQRIAQRQVFAVLEELQGAGLTIEQDGIHTFFGDQHADLQATVEVKNPVFFWRALVGGSIGAAESFVEEQWQTEDLCAVLQVFARCLPVVERLEKRFAWLRKPVNLWVRYRNRNTRDGSRTNIAAHYDLGNAMYEHFLDPLMQYSSAIFPNTDATLEQAQEHKLQSICEQLQLKPTDHLLEIGTGWGGLACYAAKHYGCRVTTTTISNEQYKVATKRAVEMGVADQITFLLQDYRDLHGQYDKIVSIEMIEAVGHEYFGEYFACLDRHLQPEGLLLIQAITIADQRYDSYRNSVDFINRYIFPGGCLPSVSEMLLQLRQRTSLQLRHIETFGDDYAQTLRIWHQRFNAQASALAKLGYNEDFQRLWRFYFCYCEAGFRENTIDLVHFVCRRQYSTTK